MCRAEKLGRLAANAVNDKRQGSATRHGSQGGGGAGNGAAASTAQGLVLQAVTRKRMTPSASFTPSNCPLV